MQRQFRGDYNGQPSAKILPKLAMATHFGGYLDIEAGYNFFAHIIR